MLKPILLLAITALPVFAAERISGPTARMPEVTSTADSGLSEERRIGETGRPEWTSARRFPTTRVYIQQEPWHVGVEQWWRLRENRDDTVQNLFIEEIEIGLPYRMQLDLYANWTVDDEMKSRYDNFSVELRYALADWGKIWGNPTLYGEYKWVDKGSDVFEFKLLLGDELMPRLHWAVNFAYEKEFGNADRTAEFQVAGGLSYSVIDSKIGIGVEAKYVRESTHFDRGEPEQKFLIGPSVQIRLTERLHVDLSCLFGTNRDAQRHEGWLVIGYEFGKIGGSEEKTYTPVSAQRH